MRASLLSALLLASLAAAADTYTTKYDNVNVETILRNDRLYKKYFNCLAGRTKCTPDGKALKEILPDALATDCEKCNEKQKRGADKVLRFMMEKRAADFALLEKIYDPQGLYRKKYAMEVLKERISPGKITNVPVEM